MTNWIWTKHHKFTWVQIRNFLFTGAKARIQVY